MASNINPNNIDGTYPIASINNDSQGFRTNFANISTNFAEAKAEIEALQAGVTPAANLGTVSGTVDINYNLAPYQHLVTNGVITFTLSNFPTSNYGVTRVEVTVTNVAHTLTLPASVVNGVQFIDGYATNVITFSSTGVFVFEIYTYDNITFTANDLTRVAASLPAGGTTGQILIKDSAADGDASWQDDPGGGGGVPAGGTTGQILVKQSATDGDADWQDQGTAAATQTEFCPGYTFVYVSDFVFRINGLDARGVFGQGRRLKFTDGASTYYGVVISAVYATNTTITMSMENSDILTNSITEVCAVTSTVNWAPILSDPFSGDKIWDIATGAIGGTQYWIAVGDGGKVFYSTDAGVNWTAGTGITTTYPIRCVSYDNTNEKFWIGGQNSANDFPYLAVSTNGTSWASQAMPLGITTAVNDYLHEIQYNLAGDYFICSFFDNSDSNYEIFVTNDEFANGTVRLTSISADGLLAADESGLAANNNQYWTYSSGVSSVYYTSFADASGTSEKTGTALITANSNLYIGEANVYGVVGQSDGKIEMGTMGSTEYDDDVTFSNAIRRFCHSQLLDRTVCVGDAATIGYIDDANMVTSNGGGTDAWTAVDNGFGPTANILSVAYNESDAVFVAVADNGQICRSTTGLGTAGTPSFSGWTAIAADPFSGGNISEIVVGTIGVTEWWVAIGGTSLYTSTDAGITWTVRTVAISGTLRALAYDATNQEFFVGGTGGHFAFSTNGTTWTADTSTIAAASAGLGSYDIRSARFDQGGGHWHIIYNRNTTTGGTITVAGGTLNSPTWVEYDTSLASSATPPQGHEWSNASSNRLFWCNNEDIYYHDGYTDTSDTQWCARSGSNATCVSVEDGTGVGATTHNIVIGVADGAVEIFHTSSRKTYPGLFTGQPNAIAWNGTRYVIVGTGSEIWTITTADLDTPGSMYQVTNTLTGDINDVAYSASDGMFICVTSTGVIARSTDGIS